MVDWKAKSTEELEKLEYNYTSLLNNWITDATYVLVGRLLGEIRAELEGRSDK